MKLMYFAGLLRIFQFSVIFPDLFKKLNQFQLTRNMDIVGWDNYPSPKDDASFPALKHDIMRALKDGASYMVESSLQISRTGRNIIN